MQPLDLGGGFMLDRRRLKLAPTELWISIWKVRPRRIPAAKPINKAITDLDIFSQKRIANCPRFTHGPVFPQHAV